MTSKVSNKKVSPVLHNFMCGVRTKIKMAIIICILHLAAAPAVIISLIAGIYSKNPVEMASTFAVIGIITTSIAGFVGIFIAIDSFSCLHNKSVVDMRLSLPLTATQRFFSNFLSGFAVYIVPFLAAQIVSLLGMAYGFIFMEGRTFEEFSGYNSSGEIRYREYTCDYFSMGMAMLLKLILAGILAMLMLYTITVLVTVCCGNKFESIAYTILINIMIPLTIYLVFMSMFSELFGVYISDNILMIIMYTSPAGGILAAVNWAVGGAFSRLSMNYAVWTIVYFLITAAIGAGAFFLYRKRRAEQVSKPFVFKLIYHIISTAAIFCIYSVFYYNVTGIVPAILTTAIVYLILEFAAKRGFKKMWVSLIKYVGVMAASMFIIFIAHKTEGFGMVERIPDISQVKYVEMDYSGFYDMFSQPHYGGEKIKLKFTEKENIETIISAHQTAVNNRHKDFAPVGTDIEIRYHLKNGRTMIRVYNVMTAEETEIMSRIDLTDEYKTQIAEIYKKEILDKEDIFKSYTAYDTQYAYSLKTQFFSDCGVSLLNETQRGINTATLVERGFFDRLAEAYEKDIMNITEENYYKSELKNKYRLTLDTHLYNITIPESFSNTLAVVEQFGFTVEKMEELPDKEVSGHLENSSKAGNLLIFTAKEWREMNTVPDGVPLHASYDLSRGMDNRINVENIDRDVCDLFRAAEPMNIVPDNGYIIYVFGRTGVIPEELNGVAERVYAGISRNDDTEHGENVYPFWLESTDENITPQVSPTGTTAYYVYD